MPSQELHTLIQYLEDKRPFLEVVEAAFLDGLNDLHADALYLYQLTEDSQNVRMIAQVTRNASFEREMNISIPRNQMPYLQNSIYISPSGMEDGTFLFVEPIFIHNRAAMHIVAERHGEAYNMQEIREMGQLSLVLQSVAQDRNFQDSLQNSYKFLETAIDEIPVGLAVLTPDSTTFLMMNQVAAESIGMQNTMLKAIAYYREGGNEEHPELYDDETGMWYDVRFREAIWIDGSPALLCTCIDVTQKMKNQQRIEYQANNDYLTGLFNRMKCERDLAMTIERCIAKGERGVVLFLDLDNFKQVNDGLGHQYGDVLLQEIANGIHSVPQITNHCYRMGGDEFVIVIPPESFSEITKIVDQISLMFNEPWQLIDVEYYCTMSMGLAIFPDHATNVQEIIQKADYAMYEAKKGGKNRYKWYEPDDPQKKQKIEFEKSIRLLVGEECKDFVLHYQPVFDENERIIGAEALVRICSDEFGELLPAEFLPVAEYLGLMNRIGNHVLEMACEKLATWRKMFSPDFKMFVNVASTQLLQPRAVEKILSVIEKTGVQPANVVLDVSERIEFRDEEKALSTLEILHAHGVLIAMDDFGSGKQSITLLQRLKASYIKFDNSFLAEHSDRALREGIVGAVRTMAEAMGSQIGFVGVETEAHHSYALEHGGTCMEGFYYGEPLEADAFELRWR